MTDLPPPYTPYPPPAQNAQFTGFSEMPNTAGNSAAARPPASGWNVPPPVIPKIPFSRDVEAQLPDDRTNQPGLVTDSFSNRSLRLGFIRKVYGIIVTQLLVTAAIVCLFLFVTPLRNYIRSSAGLWVYYLSYATFLVTYITLACCTSIRRKSPGNYICLSVFTLAFSYMLATISSFHDIQAILIALGVTIIVTVGVSIFACQTKIDFTMCSGLLCGLSLVLFMFGIGVGIAAAVSPYDLRTFYILQITYGSLGALVFTLFLIYDTQKLIGGKNRKYQLSEEDYIEGALEIYLDIVYIFIMILQIVGGSSSSS